MKLGGNALAETLSALFLVAMRWGRVSVAWSTGVIKWLFQGKEDVLDPGGCRGVVLPSLVGETSERVLLQRMFRCLRAKDALSPL